MRVVDRRRSTTRAPRTPCSACGRTARRSPRATPAPTCACSCCTGRCRRGAALRARDAAAARSRCASRCGRSSTASQVDLRPVRRPAAAAHLRALGRVGGADARARAAPAAAPFPFDLVHAHYAAPAGDAVRRARTRVPLVVSVHGGDVLSVVQRPARRRAPCGGRSARAARARQLGRHRARAPARSAPRDTRVVHLGTDVPPAPRPQRARDADDRHRRPPRRPQAPRRRPARAVAAARRPSRPALGRGRRRPGAAGARARWRRSSGVDRRVEFTRRAAARARRSRAGAHATRVRRSRAIDEAFGVAYVEAMAGGIPAIGCRGEAGPEEIAAAGGGIRLVAARRPGERWPASSRRCSTTAAWRASSARARARPSSALHLGGVRRARRSPPTRRRCGDSPVLSSPTTRRRSASARSQALHEREDVVFALIGGDVATAAGAVRRTCRSRSRPCRAATSAAGRLRALPRGRRGTSGPRRAARRLPRRAPGARAVRAVGALWAHPRTPRTRRSYLPLRHLYRHADAIVTYGPHVVRLRALQGRAQAVVEAPQSVDDAFWTGAAGRPDSAPRRRSRRCLSGETSRGKGLEVLSSLESSGLQHSRRAGSGRRRSDPSPGRRHRRGPAEGQRRPAEVRNFYAGSDVVVVPSRPHARLPRAVGPGRQRSLQPGSPVIATDAVGAAAGGLVRHERTGLVVPPGTRTRSPPRCAAARRPGAAGAAGRGRRARRRGLHARRVGGRSVGGACGRGAAC